MRAGSAPRIKTTKSTQFCSRFDLNPSLINSNIMTTAFDRRRIQAPEDSYAPTFVETDPEAGPSNHAASESKPSKPICEQAQINPDRLY